MLRPVFIALVLAACSAGCARNRPPMEVLDAIHDVARHAPVYVDEANGALDETAHPDAERLKGIGDRLVNALDALDRWAWGLQKRQPVPLGKQHLPSPTTASSHVVLKIMRDLKHVNRIASGQKLEFAPIGMTIIYGGNGSGKSGYSRVLKRTCRSRDLVES